VTRPNWVVIRFKSFVLVPEITPSFLVDEISEYYRLLLTAIRVVRYHCSNSMLFPRLYLHRGGLSTYRLDSINECEKSVLVQLGDDWRGIPLMLHATDHTLQPTVTSLRDLSINNEVCSDALDYTYVSMLLNGLSAVPEPWERTIHRRQLIAIKCVFTGWPGQLPPSADCTCMILIIPAVWLAFW